MKRPLMKLSFVLIILCTQYLNAQGKRTEAETLKYRLLDSVCNCISRADIGSVNTAADASSILSDCIMRHTKLLGDYSEVRGIPWNRITKEQLRELTTYVASEVYNNCPAIKAIIGQGGSTVDTVGSSALKNRLTDSICICISKIDTSSVRSLDDVQNMLTRCIVESESLLNMYAKSMNIDLSTEKNLQIIGETIAAEVFRKCASMKAMIDRYNKSSK